MPLPLPDLDRLTYDELAAEARSSLPALAPGWTDYNAHDPGITLLELFAWLAEGASYRLNNIPDESYRAFLRLVGVELRPARVAETLLVITLQKDASSLTLTEGVRVQAKDGSVVFQTAAPLYVSGAKLQAVLCKTGLSSEDLTGRNAAAASAFLPLGEKPKPGDALYLGFNTALAPENTLVSLGVWTGHSCEDLNTRTKLEEEQADEDEDARSCPDEARQDQPDRYQHYGVRTVWEYFAEDGKWHSLQAVIDDTRALTLSGLVQFKAPEDHKKTDLGIAGSDELFFVRCRLDRGAYDCPPRIASLALNAVRARHAVDAAPHTFCSNGRAGQQFMLAAKPVLAGSTQMTITQNSVVDAGWSEAPSWGGTGPLDRTYLLSPEAGDLIFGDGRRGRVPSAGAEISVAYRTGGGAGGNVPAGTLVQLTPGQAVEVNQPFPACGGAKAETLNEAKARAVRELAIPTRAVTLPDFEFLALETPGVPVARAHAIPEYHPAMPCINVSGSTTVVVLPNCPSERPEPTRALLATVRRYLERRRLLTSELHVIGPHYTTVSVQARLSATPEADRRALIRRARSALDKFFHPLQGGPEGRGWPIGRAVYRSELLALLNDMDGVQYVEELTWRVDGRPASRCGNITICRHGLVASGTHEITVNEGSVCHE
jgi:predicted phage baseplate assembly protein